MIQYITYNTLTGKIGVNYSGSILSADMVLALLNDNEDYITSTDVTQYTGNLYYITDLGNSNTISARPIMSNFASWNKTSIQADGVDEAVFGTSLPTVNVEVIPNGILEIETSSITVTDGSFEFSTPYAGKYVINIDYFPYQYYTETIKAT
tara:strand:+ start:3544 stop:3996 length:453 start_codon:yes stop_codon:yes gene_type:complete